MKPFMTADKMLTLSADTAEPKFICVTAHDFDERQMTAPGTRFYKLDSVEVVQLAAYLLAHNAIAHGYDNASLARIAVAIGHMAAGYIRNHELDQERNWLSQLNEKPDQEKRT